MKEPTEFQEPDFNTYLHAKAAQKLKYNKYKNKFIEIY